MMTFNEFQRELQAKHQIDIAQQVTQAASATLALAESLQNFVNLNELMINDVNGLKRIVHGDGEMVHSVLPEPEDS